MRIGRMTGMKIGRMTGTMIRDTWIQGKPRQIRFFGNRISPHARGPHNPPNTIVLFTAIHQMIAGPRSG